MSRSYTPNRRYGYKRKRSVMNNSNYHAEYKVLDCDSGYIATGTSNGEQISRLFADDHAAFEDASICVNAMAQGQAVNQHIGDRVKPIKLTIRGTIQNHSNEAQPTVCRIMIVHDRHGGATSSVGGVTELLKSYSGTYNNGHLCFNNLANRHRFTVLKDKFVSVGWNDTVNSFYDNGVRKFVKINVNLRNLPATLYAPGTALRTAEGIVEGAIYVLCVGEFGTASAQVWSFKFLSRYRYQDM